MRILKSRKNKDLDEKHFYCARSISTLQNLKVLTEK